MTEALLSILLWTGVAMGGGQILFAGWNRLHCMRTAFGAGHAELLGERTFNPRSTAQVTHHGSKILAHAQCRAISGLTHEEVGFEKLEFRN